MRFIERITPEIAYTAFDYWNTWLGIARYKAIKDLKTNDTLIFQYDNWESRIAWALENKPPNSLTKGIRGFLPTKGGEG